MTLMDRIRSTFAIRVKAMVQLVETWKDAKASYPETNFPSLVKHGLRKNELIYACVSAKANTAAQVQMEVTRRGSEEVFVDHPLSALLQNPNPFMSEFEFWGSVITYLDLAGRAVYEKQRDKAGNVIALWPLRPDWCMPIQSAKSFVSGYEYTVPGSEPVPMRKEDLLEFKLFDPLSIALPWPPVAVAARVGDVDNQTTDFLKIFFEKGAIPPAIIKSSQKLTDDQVTDIKRRWIERYGGSDHWTEPAVLDKDASYQQIGMNFAEMGFGDLDARNEARICAVLKVPPIIVGAKVGLDRSTYTNYGEARRAWWEDVLIPVYTSFIDVIQNQLVPDFGQDIHVRWNFSGVIALREEQTSRWTRAAEALRLGGITVNEYRRELGLPMDPFGNIYIRALNVTQVPSGAPQPVAKVAITSAAPALLEAKVSAQSSVTRDKAEALLREDLEEFFAEQAERITAEIERRGSE